MSYSTPKPTLSPLDALTQARALIADPCAWTRSAAARRPRIERRTKGGETWSYEPTEAPDPKACKWCAAGALGAISGKRSGSPGFAELEAASIGLTGLGIGVLNDRRETDHQTILAVYDRAITGAKTALTT